LVTETTAEVTAPPSEGLPPLTDTDDSATAPTGAVTDSLVPATEEMPQPAWASVSDAYEVLELPDIKAIRERDDRRRDEDQRAVFEREFETKHKDWESTNLNRTVQSAFGRVLEKLADADVDGFEKAIARVETLVQPYLDDVKQQTLNEGALAAAKQFKGLFRTGLDRKSSDELDDFAKLPSTTWQDLFDFREKAKIERVTAPLKAKLEAAEAEIERLKVGVRDGKGPPLSQGVGGSGKSYADMSREDRAALSTEERDRLTRLS